jgi:tetratricopeptide (TPR) repeat protein
MFRFSHRRKVHDLDELSNKAKDLIRAGQWAEAERVCGRLRELFPDEIDADDRMGQFYQAQKKYAEAIPFAQTALDKARRHPDKFDADLVAELAEQVVFLKQEAAP